MKIAQIAAPPSIVHAVDEDGREDSLRTTPEASGNLKFDSPDSKANTQAHQQSDVSVAHNKAEESQDSHVSRHTACYEASSQNVQNLVRFLCASRAGKKQLSYPTSVPSTMTNS